MRFVLLFIVAVGWVLVLASWLRSRSESRGVNSISSFSRHLSVLERTSPARETLAALQGSGVPAPVRRPNAMRMTIGDARRRRRDLLVCLAGTSLVLGVLALTAGSVFVALFVLAVVAFGAYVALLVRAQRIGAERQAKVRYLPQPAALEPPSGYWLQQSAN